MFKPTFPSKLRLRSNTQFREVYQRSRRFAAKSLTVLARPNQLEYARIGASIAKKNIRHAVARNRIKRIIRESFRHRHPQLGGIDIVIRVNKGADSLSNHELQQQLEQQWTLLTSYYQKSRS